MFLLPSVQGGDPIGHPRVVLTQALAKHIEQLVALPDELLRETIARYKQLCDTCGCHNEQELSEALSVERKPRRCPLARFLRLRVCGQLGVQARLSACLSLGKAEREASWHSLLMHLSRRASASDADAGFRSDVELVTASWAAIRRCFRGQGVRQPRQLVLDPRVQPAVWLISTQSVDARAGSKRSGASCPEWTPLPCSRDLIADATPPVPLRIRSSSAR